MRRRRERTPYEIVVLTTGDKATLGLARSMLESANIAYELRNDALQDYFTWGRLGGFNVALGPAKVLVNKEDADTARELLGNISQSGPRLPRSLRIAAIIVLLFALYGLIVGVLEILGFK